MASLTLRLLLRPRVFIRAELKRVQHRCLSSNLSLDSYIISPQELSSALRKAPSSSSTLSTAPRIIPLCAAWFMPNDPEKRTGYQTYLERRIPQARFFDLDKVKDENSPYPHMIPSPQTFANEMGRLGIRRDDSVVVYDTVELGIFSAPRVAWMLKVFGHDGVHILNNFKLWVEQGLPVERGEPEPVQEIEYPVPALDKSKVVFFEELKERASKVGKEGAKEVAILDARSPGRFDGTDPEPREGLTSGHMPGSYNIPFNDLLSARTKAFLTPSELKLYFEIRNVDPKTAIISSCGTGVTACVVDAALSEAGYPEDKKRVYDGSWTEWAQRVQPEDNLIKKS